ncbi:hypothetical protein FOA52_007590 [Chlamydomonas sp. UWO 241]|nr:hypothetical protein FOA52_007590 [Chlamydomonas sp. UWO 241]
MRMRDELTVRGLGRALRGLVRPGIELLCELLLTVAFLKAYNYTRNQFGSSREGSTAVALGHALQVVAAERALGIYWEESVQAAALGSPVNIPWIRGWDVFYCTAHMALTIFVLLFLFALRPVAYQRARTTVCVCVCFMVMNLVAIVGFAAWPLMPPRLLPACDEYGGCMKQFTYVDTMHVYGGLWSWKQKGVSKVSNHYAAMPSMHAGYSLWCSISMYEHCPYRTMRAVFVAYPLATLYCIIATANHFFLDAVVGAMCFAAAYFASFYMPRFGRGSGWGIETLWTARAKAKGGDKNSGGGVEAQPLLSISVLTNGKEH